MSNKPPVAVPDMRNIYRRASTAPSQVQGHKRSSDHDTGAVTQSPQKDQQIDSIIRKVFVVPGSNSDDNNIRRLSMDNLSQQRDLVRIVRRDDDTVRCGNEKGLSTLDQFDELFKKVGALEEKFETQESVNKQLQAKIEEYDEKFRDQEILNENALKARKRWFSNYAKYNYSGIFDTEEEKAVIEGDQAVHHGNPLADAIMHKKKFRKADPLYQDLYGMTWEQVLENRHESQALEVLQIYATTKATQGRHRLKPWYTQRFLDFVDAFQNHPERVERAYAEFQRAHRQVEDWMGWKGFKDSFIAHFKSLVDWSGRQQHQPEVGQGQGNQEAVVDR